MPSNSTIISSSAPNTGLGDNFNKDDIVMLAIREKLASNMRTGFVELVPQDAFDKMTDLAIEEFVHGSRNKRFTKKNEYMLESDPRNPTGKSQNVVIDIPNPDYNPVGDETTLVGMIFKEITIKAKENVKETLNNMPEFEYKFDNEVGKNVVPLITEIVANNAGAFMTAMMNGVIQHTFIEAINAMRYGNGMNAYTHPLPKVKF